MDRRSSRYSAGSSVQFGVQLERRPRLNDNQRLGIDGDEWFVREVGTELASILVVNMKFDATRVTTIRILRRYLL